MNQNQCIFQILYEQNYVVCTWPFFTQCNYFESYPFCIYQQFFLLFSFIPFYGCTTICFCVYLLMNIWVISSYWLLTYKGASNMEKSLYAYNTSFLLGNCISLILNIEEQNSNKLIQMCGWETNLLYLSAKITFYLFPCVLFVRKFGLDM